jgi:hypothetical protein
MCYPGKLSPPLHPVRVMRIVGPVTTVKKLTQTHKAKAVPMGVTYQTVRLSRGNHKSPEDGACVMELASMLAGEPFSDHPTTACPVIASLLRSFNDSLDDEPRQELYEYAAKVVGSRGSRRVQRDRLDRLIAWTEEIEGRRRKRSRACLRWLGLRPSAHVVAAQAIRAVARRDDNTRSDVLALADELLAFGSHTPRGGAIRVGFTLDHRESQAPTTP